MTGTLLNFCIFLLSISPELLAQAPVIRSMTNLASGETRFSPGLLTYLRYLGPPVFSAPDRVEIGGRPVLAQDNETGDELTVLLPNDLAPGPTNVVLVMQGTSSPPFPITVEPSYTPGIFAPTRSLSDPWDQTFGCNSTAAEGETVTIFAVGVGPADLAASVSPPLVVLVGGLPATIVESTPVRFSGLGFDFPPDALRIRFVVPSGEGRRLIALFFGGQVSNSVGLPVGRAMWNLSPPTFRSAPASPESIVTAYHCSGGDFIAGPGLLTATTPELPTSLGGVSIVVRDYLGVARSAPIYAVTREQVNYVVPPGTSAGWASVYAIVAGDVVAEGDLQVLPVAPALFPEVQEVRLRNGIQTFESGLPIDLGPDTDQVYLVMYGTGFRSRTSLANVHAKIGEVDVPVEYAGTQGILPGLDQVNMRLPRSLAGRRDTQLELTVDGKLTTAPLSFK